MVPRALIKTIVFLVVVLFLVTVVYLYSNKSSSMKDIVVLQVEEKEFKRKPQDPGGITIPNSDSHIYDQLKKYSRKTSLADINILPEPEEPIVIDFQSKVENTHGSAPVSSVDEILDNLDFYERTFLVEGNANDDQGLVLPNEIAKNTKAVDVNADSSSDAASTNQQNSLHLVKAHEDIHKVIMQADDHFIGDGYFIQLAITRSEKEAKNAWLQISRKNSEALFNIGPIFKKINKKNTKVFFLVLAGPYSNQYKAKMVCEALKNNRQNCIIVK